MEEQPLPSTLDEVESLILSLYRPSHPDVIASTQSKLALLQASPQAWSIARHLLDRPDETVKFFGALTIIIKLNTESSALSDDDATDLLARLIDWYLAALSEGQSTLVARKLSSALATFFLHLHRLWPHFLRHLILCLAAGRAVPLNITDSLANAASPAGSLGPTKLRAALWVATNVVEDVAKFDLNAASNAGLHDAVVSSTAEAVDLIFQSMFTPSSPPTLVEDSLKFLQAWAWFCQRATGRDSGTVQSLQPLVSGVIDFLPRNVAVGLSMEFLTDALSSYSIVLTEQHYDAIASLFESQWSHDRYMNIVQGDFEFESMQFGELLLAFGDARVHVLMQSNDIRSQEFLSRLSGLLAASGYPAVEDKIFVPAVEFWSTYAETMADYMYSDDGSLKHWQDTALSHLLRTVSNAWQKIVYPPSDELADWDSTDLVGFGDARKDLIDLLQCTYTVAGPRLVYTFVEVVLTSLSTASWSKLEAAVFCLGGLAECTTDDSKCDDALASLFTSPLFSRLSEQAAHSTPRVRQTCVSLIERYTEYFERNPSLLPPALNLLFREVGDPSMAMPTSKSILRLCSSCRRHLHPEAGAFIDEYGRLLMSHRIDCVASEKIIGAIACVAQAIPNARARHDACFRLLRFMKDDTQHAAEMIRAQGTTGLPCPPGSRCLEDVPEEQNSLHMGLRALRCLASVAKGFQAPSDAPIELEAEIDGVAEVDPDLSHLQQLVISIILEIQSTFSENTDVTELICSVLRSGFLEVDPGPFVLPAEEVASYITGHTIRTARVGLLVSTATSFISSPQYSKSADMQNLLTRILLWVIGLLQQLPGHEDDPELSQNGIDFVSRLLLKRPAVVLHLNPSDAIEFFLLFTLHVLDGHEPLPKVAAAGFWTAFIDLRDDDSGLNGAPSQAMRTLGPLLCESLARNIGGSASRSELDKLSEPLKKLVGSYPLAKDWLEAGFAHASFPSSKVTSEQKSLFVKKVISLRGSRATNQVVREFWLSARGSSFAYAS